MAGAPVQGVCAVQVWSGSARSVRRDLTQLARVVGMDVLSTGDARRGPSCCTIREVGEEHLGLQLHHVGGLDIGRIRILVVDDDEIERYMILRFLAGVEQQLGLEVEEAESGEEAIARIGATKFDLILTDFRMGAVSGIDVLAFAMEASPTTIRILISGYASPELQKEAVQAAQVHAVLEKPMTPAELNRLLNEQVVERYLTPLARQ